MAEQPVKVMLIDDDREDYILTRDLFAEMPKRFALDWVSDFDSGLEAMTKGAHDVYLVDYRLGSRDGLELLREGIRRGCQAPIVVLTGQESEGLDEAALVAGAADYLVKGQIDASVLRRVLRYALKQKADERLLEQRVEQRAIELAQVNEALKDSEQRYRQMIEGLPAAVYTTDAEGRITLFNDAAVELWGRAPEVGRDRWCGSHRIWRTDGTELPLDKCPMAQAVKEGLVTHGAEIIVERPDGERRHVLANPRPLCNEAGQITGAINMLVDITDRHRGQGELQAAKDDLAVQVRAFSRLHDLAMQLAGPMELPEALQAILAILVELHDAQFGCVSLYDSSTGLLVDGGNLGFAPEILPALTRIKPSPTTVACGSAFATRQRAIVEDTESDPRFDGYRDVARAAGFRAVHSTPILTRSGEILGVLSVHFRGPRTPTRQELQLADLCARHAADTIESTRHQQALRDSERLYRAIGESIDYGVWICDAEGRNRYVSESFLKLVGMTQEQCSNSGWGAALHPDDLEPTMTAWKECVRQGTPWDFECRFLGVDGQYHPVLARGLPVRNERGAITGWAGISLDISRLKHIEDELRQADQRKDEFLAMLAHELRNPLAPLSNSLDLLWLTDELSPNVVQICKIMERQVKHMVRLVDDLLEVSRITRGKIDLRKEPVDLASIIRNAVETSRPLVMASEHQLALALAPEPITLEADPVRLAQVISNLLNNAAKYTERGGQIRLKAHQEGSQAVISIRDNGIGIPTEMLPRVFDLFAQVDRSLSRAQGGLGIGLSLARSMVQMHGGTIEVHSAGPGKGSEFLIRLPVSAGFVRLTAIEPKTPAARPCPASRRILVVDDTRASAYILSQLLMKMGQDVRTTDSATAALEAIRQDPPDLVISDIAMPGMDGYELARALRETPGMQNVVLVALTGYGQDGDRERARHAGFDHHLIKPVSIDALAELLDSLPARQESAAP